MKIKYFHRYLLITVFFFMISSCMLRKDIYELASIPDGSSEDIEAPEANGFSIVDVVTISSTRVRVYFSCKVEQLSAETATNYSISGLIVTGASRDFFDFSIVDLITSRQVNINYELVVAGVKDINGNLIGSHNSKVFQGDAELYLQSVSSFSSTEVIVFFSEEADRLTAEDKENYSIPGLSIISATRGVSDYSKITLVTAYQVDGTSYTITISSVKDTNGNVVAAPGAMSFIGTGAVDNTPPRVLSASLVDGDTVEVQFSEPMEQASSEAAVNYTLENHLGNFITVNAAARQADESKVWVDVSGTFSESLYILTVSPGVKDKSSNSMAGYPNNTVSFAGQGSIPENFNDGPVIVDPINWGKNNFSMLAAYKGRIYIGPSGDDNAVFRLKPDGSDPEIISFIFHGIGADTSTLNPGPDGEEGINYICGGTIGGTEYLFIGPFKTPDGSEIDYIYCTADNGYTVEFDNLYVSDYVGWYTKSVSSMIVFNDNLYIGLPNRFPYYSEKKPYFIKLQSLNPLTFVDLEGYNMPRVGRNGGNTAENIGIDSMAVYNDKLYIANGGGSAIDEDGGILRSTNNNPGDYGTSPADWEDITPVGETEWYTLTNDRFSIELLKVERLNPVDRAFPAMVVFNGKLYIARNTTDGPQLWKYDGSLWELVADNGSGLTNMSEPDNSHITLLVKNGDRLYAGYDNLADGAQIWRTAAGVADPALEADFEPVSIDGFGDKDKNKSIYCGLSIADGGTDYLWLLCGKINSSLRVYRTSN